MWRVRSERYQGKKEVMARIKDKLVDLKKKVSFYERGLQIISSLEEESYYEITDGKAYNLPCGPCFVQFKEIGVDRALFKVLAWEGNGRDIKTGSSYYHKDEKIMELSAYWEDGFSIRPINLKEAPAYINWNKTQAYEKLFK